MKFIDDNQVPYDAEHLCPIIPQNGQTEKAIEALINMTQVICENLIPTVQKMIDIFTPVYKALTEVLKTYPNKRVIYLATHGKERVRKKNINRIMKWAKRGCKNEQRKSD